MTGQLVVQTTSAIEALSRRLVSSETDGWAIGSGKEETKGGTVKVSLCETVFSMPEILSNIFGFLTPEQIVQCRGVSKTLRLGVLGF